jgi:hypothetical protein
MTEEVKIKSEGLLYPNTPLHWWNLDGFLKTLTEAPTDKPRNVREQIVIVRAGGSTAAYIYDTVALAWRYTTLT